ncbi:hypothetical protein IQ268_08650 [Oculatella sp. LEGE 06141]|uniref:hypothetical protein n=1 Tax=Oculatella sp. LEGE 06141 TaxID=1828648 RepID=UPI00187E378D|nr:hypothetical protein [Oculatella sp. LEGE 06141]MBE9178627.1 hypothetical protein [Oculatella sp. LEGE 06141]
MNLSNYPEAIAQSQFQLLLAERTVRRLQEQLTRLTAKIDSAIAFDADLKNDAQRKAKRTELLESPEYLEVAEVYQAAKDKHAEMEIELQLLLNRFSVAKLEQRHAIAIMELRTASA